MSTSLTLILLLSGPPGEAQQPSGKPAQKSVAELVSQTQETPVTREEFRAAYTHVMKLTARGKTPDLFEVAPMMLSLYKVLQQVEKMSFAERRRLKTGLEIRLTSIRSKLHARVRQLPRAEQIAANAARKSERASLQGGGAAQAMELIDLIQNTIAPESWDVNGGQGTIRYFSLIPSLVVRQSGEVHGTIGNTLNQLRKQ